MKRLLIIAAVGAFALGIASYLYLQEPKTTEEFMNPASGRLAPDFALPDLNGNHWQLSQQRGRMLLINFWATWCAPCREEMPALNRLQQAIDPERLQVIGIHSGPSPEMQEFLSETPVNFPILVDANLALSDWQIRALPTTFLLDQDGHALYWVSGIREWDSSESIEFFSDLLR